MTDSGTTRLPAVPVPIVDTTGAGDAFNAGLAVALAEGREPGRGGAFRQLRRRAGLHTAGRGRGPWGAEDHRRTVPGTTRVSDRKRELSQ